MRLFPNLPGCAAEDLSAQIGATGGACDGSDCGEASDDSHVAAGWPFFGQFLAHDLTADRSPLADRADESAIRNIRSARLNLECLYGEGPSGQPYLFSMRDPAKFLLGPDNGDVPRNLEGVALIADPRDDSHLFMSQLHLAFLKAHNHFVDRLREDGAPESTVFDQARRATMWHYQWIVLNEFLPSLCGAELVDRVRTEGTRFYRIVGDTQIPYEFADAAYRYGHSQIRHTYRPNENHPEVPLFPDLLGFRPIPPERRVDWPLLFDLPGHAPAARAKRIDGRLPGTLIRLPRAITGHVDGAAFHSLAARDLRRGHALRLPSGEAVACLMGYTPLDRSQLGLEGVTETPLWYYILREADIVRDGDGLGPVGATIVAEVLVGMLGHDPESFLTVAPDWQPTLRYGEAPFGLATILAL
jgi:hypothetical protein